MRRAFDSLVVAAGLLLCACPPMQMGSDAGEPEGETEYTGVVEGNIPGFTNGVIDAGNESPIDAGAVVVDPTCCFLNFSIPSGDEPQSASAVLKGEVRPLLDGLPLSRGLDGGFSASACFPINRASYYWYEFEWQTDDADAGGLSMGDGGYLLRLERHSPDETNYPIGDGSRRNFIPSVSTCAQLDAGTGP